jgi:putative aldouronate transport system permease protein
MLLTCFIIFAKLCYNKFSDGAIITLDVLYLLMYVLFLAEFIYRITTIYKLNGKEGIVSYLKFNKAEPLYMIIAPIVAVFAIVASSSGASLKTAEFLQWIIILKIPAVLRNFNDEIVFNIIAKIIMALLVIVFVVPFLNIIALSFSSPHTVVNILPNDFTWYSVNFVLTYKQFWNALSISVLVTIIGTLGSVLMMIMAAYPLSKPGMPLRKTTLVFFLIVMLFSGGMAPKIIVMNILGLLDNFWALVLPSFINVFHLLLLKGFFEGLPQELEESAKLDGANNYDVLFKIVVPLSLPMVATVSMFTAIVYWNNFNNALMYVVAKTDLYPIPMFIRNFTNMSEQSISMSDPILADHLENVKMALMLLSIVPIMCAYPFILKTFTKGVAVGSVKG